MLFTTEDSQKAVKEEIDEYGDSYARDTTIEELREVCTNLFGKLRQPINVPQILDRMPEKFEHPFSSNDFRNDLEQHSIDLGALPGWMFEKCVLYFDQLETAKRKRESDHGPQDLARVLDLRARQACITGRFGGAKIVHDLDHEVATHVLVGDDRGRIQELQERLSTYDIPSEQRYRGSELLTWSLFTVGAGYRVWSRWIGSSKAGRRRRCWTKNVRVTYHASNSSSLMKIDHRLRSSLMTYLDGDYRRCIYEV